MAFLNKILHRFWGFHHMWCIISLKYTLCRPKTQGHEEETVNGCNLQALRRHSIKNRLDSVVEITAWAQEHFWKTAVSKHSSHPQCILNVYHAQCINKIWPYHGLLTAHLIFYGLKRSGKMCSGPTNQNLKFLFYFSFLDAASSGL